MESECVVQRERVVVVVNRGKSGRGEGDEDAFGNHSCESSVNDIRHEKTVETGQIQAEYSREWGKLFGDSRSSLLLALVSAITRLLKTRAYQTRKHRARGMIQILD